MKKLVFLVIILLWYGTLMAGTLDNAILLYSEKSYEEASSLFISVIDEKDISTDEKAKAYFYLGKIELADPNADKEVALNHFTESFYYAKGEPAGDAACEMALICDETTKTINASILYERLYKGEIPTSNETFGRAAYSYGLFSVRKLKDKELAKEIFYNLDSGKTKATPPYVSKARYTLGHIVAKENNFKEAFNLFCRADFSDQETNKKADQALQVAWTCMEYCRKLADAGETDPNFTFSKARELCKGVSSKYDLVTAPGLVEKFNTYFAAVADLMYLETYWYNKEYDKVPSLVNQFFGKYECDPYRKRELAMARFWSVASYHKMGNYNEAFEQLDLLEKFDEEAQKGFMNVPAYALLIKADCYYRQGNQSKALLRLRECLDKYPEFTKRRVPMKDSFPVYELFDKLSQ